MKRTAAVACLAVCLSLLACGAPDGAKLGGGKEGAATAVFTAAQAPLVEDGFLDELTRGAQPAGFTRACSHGGSVTVAADAAASAPSFTAVFRKCSFDFRTQWEGSTRLTLLVEKVGTGWAASVAFTGKLTMTGEISDTLEFDVTHTASVKSLRTENESVTLTVRGFAQTTTARYQFANEPLTLTPGKLTPAPTSTDRSSRT